VGSKQLLFEIEVPIKETWVFTVSARSAEEALEKYYDNDTDVEQTCSVGGWPEQPHAKNEAGIPIVRRT
jgi:hypothetical protein